MTSILGKRSASKMESGASISPKTEFAFVDTNKTSQPDMDPEAFKAVRGALTDEFINLCLVGSPINAISFYYENRDFIDLRAKKDEAFRNACMNGDVDLVRMICREGHVPVSTCKHIGFNLACLGQHIELAEWFRSVDPKYYFEIIDGTINVQTHKYLGGEPQPQVNRFGFMNNDEEDDEEIDEEFDEEFDEDDGCDIDENVEVDEEVDNVVDVHEYNDDDEDFDQYDSGEDSPDSYS